MNYIDEIFLRGDIQQIRAFLISGAEASIDPRTYKERVDSAEKALFARLRVKYSEQEAVEEMTKLVFDYAGEIESVYMEIGLQIGAMLAAQACQNLKTALME